MLWYEYVNTIIVRPTRPSALADLALRLASLRAGGLPRDVSRLPSEALVVVVVVVGVAVVVGVVVVVVVVAVVVVVVVAVVISSSLSLLSI